MNDADTPPRGELLGNFQFPRSDRVVHLRPGFGLALGRRNVEGERNERDKEQRLFHV